MAQKITETTEIKTPASLRFSKVIVWVMYVWVLIGVISLSIRVFLLATSANTATGFANFIMNVSRDYLEPFRGIFPGKDVGTTGYLDVSAIFAIIVYLFVLWGFRSLIDYVQNKIDVNNAIQRDKVAQAKRKALLESQKKNEIKNSSKKQKQ
jgi:uncharacterized protein YggT (Ycf19 family)